MAFLGRLPPAAGNVGNLFLGPCVEVETGRSAYFVLNKHGWCSATRTCHFLLLRTPFLQSPDSWKPAQGTFCAPAAPCSLSLNGMSVVRETRPTTASPSQQRTVFITLAIYFWALKVKHPFISWRSLELCPSEELRLDCRLSNGADGSGSGMRPI